MTNLDMKIGQHLECLYPQHGSRNILCKQSGIIDRIGETKGGSYVTINRENGSYRSLRFGKIVNAIVE